jgi:hypothetical protein
MSRTMAEEIDKVRDIIAQITREQQVSDDEAEDARNTIRAICKEASTHGLTTAEVVRAICRPVFEGRSRGCNCPSCRARREQLTLVGVAEGSSSGDQPPTPVV